MATLKHNMSDIEDRCEYQSKSNEKLALQAARGDQRKADKKLPMGCRPAMRKKPKTFKFECKQHGIANNSQGA
jgi:hypothetical protein